jgi:hypothetical protein
MIYSYTIFGTFKNSDEKISRYTSIPLGLSQEDFLQEVIAFCKAFNLTKIETT